MTQDNVDDILILSPMQRLMLTHALTATGSSVLANTFRYRITGALDDALFARAWQALVDRHPALRTCFLWEDLADPVQVVRSTARLSFAREDLRALSPRDREARIAELLEAERHAGTDLRRAPLMRIVLARTGEEEHCMLWSRHHLILDRWCVDLVFDELFRFYADGGAGAALPPVRGFGDYLDWIQQQDAEAAAAYWRGEFEGFDRPSLLFDPAAPASNWLPEGLPSVTGALSAAEHGALGDFARGCRVSQATVLQAAVGLTIAAWSGSRDVTFGVTVSGRPPDVPGIESMMGSFINNVPVRMQVRPEMPVTACLRALQAAQSRRVPFEYASPVDILRWTGISAAEPLFDVLALMHSPATESRKGPGFAIEQLSSSIDTLLPLSLSLADAGDGLAVVGAFDPARVTQHQAQRFVNDLCGTLQRLSGSSDALLGTFLAPGPSVNPPVRAPASRCDVPRDSGSSLECALREIWRDTLGVDTVSLDDDFFALGGTSVQAAIAFAAIERAAGKTLPISTLFRAGSVRKLLEVLEQPVRRTSSLVPIQPRGERPPLFVVPGIGGNVVSLNDLARAGGRDQPFFGLQSRGLDGQEDPATKIEDIAAGFLDDMPPVEPGSYVLCGICWGASVAFEMARQLTDRGCAPRLLILLDPLYDGGGRAVSSSASAAGVKLRFLVDRLRLYWNDARALSPGERLQWLRRKAKVLRDKFTSGDLYAGNRTEIIRRRVTTANLVAQTNYRPRPCGNPAVVLATAGRGTLDDDDPRLAWLRFLPPGTPVRAVPGGNTGEAIEGRNAVVLAGEIRAQLTRAETSPRA